MQQEGESAKKCDNNYMRQDLRVWTLENLETLNLKNIAFKINKLLEKPTVQLIHFFYFVKKKLKKHRNAFY